MAKRKSNSGFIYLWYDRKHKRFYLGSHWGSPDDGYICSSPWMKAAYERRPNDFKRRIIETITTDRIELYEREFQWLNLITPEEIKTRYYNLNITKYGWPSGNETVRERMSKALRDRYDNDPEWAAARRTHMSTVGKAKLSSSYFEPGNEPWNKDTEGLQVAWNKGITGDAIPWTGKERPDVQQRMLSKNPNASGDSMRGKHHSEESKRKSADSNRGQKRTESTKAKLKEHHTGRRWYTNGQIDVKAKEQPEGFTVGRSQKKPMSAEAQERARLARIGLVWWNNGIKATKSKTCPGDNWVRGKTF